MDTPEGRFDVPVKLRVHDSLFVPLAKWSMLLAGNYRCVTKDGMRAAQEAVHSNLRESRSEYDFVVERQRRWGNGCPRALLGARFLLIRIEAEATAGAAADLLDGRCLLDCQAGAGHHEATYVNEVPGLSHAFDGAALAHRRDHDAVAELEAADPPGTEECAHRYRPARFSVAAP